MITFKQYYTEQNTAGPGGALGTWTDTGGSFGNKDSYAPNDSRMLSPYGPAGATLGAKIIKKGKRNKNNKRSVLISIPMQKRTLTKN